MSEIDPLTSREDLHDPAIYPNFTKIFIGEKDLALISAGIDKPLTRVYELTKLNLNVEGYGDIGISIGGVDQSFDMQVKIAVAPLTVEEFKYLKSLLQEYFSKCITQDSWLDPQEELKSLWSRYTSPEITRALLNLALDRMTEQVNLKHQETETPDIRLDALNLLRESVADSALVFGGKYKKTIDSIADAFCVRYANEGPDYLKYNEFRQRAHELVSSVLHEHGIRLKMEGHDSTSVSSKEFYYGVKDEMKSKGLEINDYIKIDPQTTAWYIVNRLVRGVDTNWISLDRTSSRKVVKPEDPFHISYFFPSLNSATEQAQASVRIGAGVNNFIHERWIQIKLAKSKSDGGPGLMK